VIGPGDVTLFDTFAIAPFPNFISIVEELTPAQFKSLMENSVSLLPAAAARFGQIAGFTLVYDVEGTAQTYAGNTVTIETPGSRVVSITLDDGTKIIECGVPAPGAPNVNLATIDFLARGGDQYPFPSSNRVVNLGAGYQKALENYIVSGLGRRVTAAGYPSGGEGRIRAGAACQ
jgi:5'-nucleotidase